MIRRVVAVSAWVIGVAIGVSALLGLFVTAFISPGLGRTDTAEIFAALGIAALTVITAIYTGVLGVRGRALGIRFRETWRRAPPRLASPPE